MNQILETSLKNKKEMKKKFRKILKIQFLFSIFFIVIIGVFITYNSFKIYKKEKYSKQILNNYNITKLYSNSSYNNLNISTDTSSQEPYVLGIIDIPKINIYYPIFSKYDDELLKISPCRFYGPDIGKNGNLCIAGHNYDNNKFFSKISSLQNNDEITIYDNSNKAFSYFVFNIYEVNVNDFSPIYSYNYSSELTLITCNNLNNNRIIVKAVKR